MYRQRPFQPLDTPTEGPSDRSTTTIRSLTGCRSDSANQLHDLEAPYLPRIFNSLAHNVLNRFPDYNRVPVDQRDDGIRSGLDHLDELRVQNDYPIVEPGYSDHGHSPAYRFVSTRLAGIPLLISSVARTLSLLLPRKEEQFLKQIVSDPNHAARRRNTRLGGYQSDKLPSNLYVA